MKTLLFVCSLLLCLGITGCRQNEKELKITAYVNPFIGTDGHGHCFPGAILPFGGIQLSPDNPRNGWDWTSGYHYSDSIISSFSHTHLSGTGIGDLQDIRFLPVSTTPDTSISPIGICPFFPPQRAGRTRLLQCCIRQRYKNRIIRHQPMRYPLLSIPCQLGPCSDYRFNHRPQLGPNDRNKYP